MELRIACTVRDRLHGLIGQDDFAGTLLIVPCHDIHTFGMSCPIDVAFILRDGTVVESHRNVRPGRRLANRRAVATLERVSCQSDWPSVGDVPLRWACNAAPPSLQVTE